MLCYELIIIKFKKKIKTVWMTRLKLLSYLMP